MPNREPGNPIIVDTLTKRDGTPTAKKLRLEAAGKDLKTVKRWQVRWSDYDGRQKSESFQRKVDAKAFASEITAQFQRSEYVSKDLGNVTIEQLHRRGVEASVHLSEKTKYEQKLIWKKHVQDRFGFVRARDIRRSDVQEWIAEMHNSGAGEAVKSKALQVLRQALNYGVDAGHIRANPALGVQVPHEPSRDRNYLSVKQVEALSEAVGEPHDLLVRVLAFCGLRWGEATALRVRDVDLDRRRLKVTRAYSVVGGRHVLKSTKTHESRTVPFPLILAPDLEAAVNGRENDALLFQSGSGGPLSPSNFRQRVFNPALNSVDIPTVTLHDLRHTAASLAISAGASVKAVQRMLGHASAAMTLDRYADLFDDDLDRVAEALDNLIQRDK